MSKEWIKLDNAAKIFPSSGNGADTQVFRLSCELGDIINCEMLQTALEDTLKIFDIYKFNMKRGFFWYYLEKTDIIPIVKKEYKQPCSEIYHWNKNGLLFEVTYFKKRINLEVYHVLSDGTGAINFFRTLITKYICLFYKLDELPLDYDASRTQMKDDSFAKYYSHKKIKSKDKFKTACQIRGTKLSENRLNIITGHLSVSELLKITHKYGVTITNFLSACLMEAIGKEISNYEKKKDIVLGIPVDLRKYFPSQSARNFFGLIFTKYNFYNEDGTFESILKKISTDLEDNLNEENLKKKIDVFSNIEHNLFAKLIPLPLKDVFLRTAYNISMHQSTASLSNVGIIKMPDEVNKYICSFDVFTGTEKLQICLCTFSDILSINFTSPFVNTDIQRLFFRKLSSIGLNVEIYSNITEDE